MTTVAGSVDRIVFCNPESGFCVARFQLAGEPGGRTDASTTIVGTMPSLRAGEMLRITGEWQTHPVHGRNFRVERFEQEIPDTTEGIERYLASGAIQGIGPVTAARIVEHFGAETMTVLGERPALLREVAGISVKRARVIADSWAEQQRVRELAMFLEHHGISMALAHRIYRVYGDKAIESIQRDPYQLAHDVQGIGFKTADAVAATLGISRRAASRYVAGLKYTLSRSTDEGHVYLSRPDLLARASRLLDAPVTNLEPALLELLQRGDAVLDDDAVYLTPFFRAETGIVRALEELSSTASVLILDRSFNPAEAVAAAAEAQGLALAALQTLGAEQALSRKVSILTGGPGTGKTSTLRTVITALETAGTSFCLCAPTGRAAKRVTETTGRAASTIHRLLEFQPGLNVFNHDQDHPLLCDFIIVDETSMLDVLLFYHLLKAIPRESHLLLVGDADQLPAVGPGNVLRDLLTSGTVPAVTLTELFRQARGSQIVLAAHAVNRGLPPSIENLSGHDLYFVRAEDDGRVVESIKRLLTERIPRTFGLDPIEDVQVLSPMHAGAAGVTTLNVALQQLLNPDRPSVPQLRRGDRLFRLGDKVMQTRNNYDKDVYNGDVGRVTQVLSEEQRLIISYSSGSSLLEIEYDALGLDELVLAYAVSVHKAQGSEFPCVVMPIVPSHAVMLQRNLLYTAITRAKQLCVLVGSPRTLASAAVAERRQQRNTRLSVRLTKTTATPLQSGLV